MARLAAVILTAYQKMLSWSRQGEASGNGAIIDGNAVGSHLRSPNTRCQLGSLPEREVCILQLLGADVRAEAALQVRISFHDLRHKQPAGKSIHDRVVREHQQVRFAASVLRHKELQFKHTTPSSSLNESLIEAYMSFTSWQQGLPSAG